MKNITQPTLLIDHEKVVSNIHKMKQKVDESGVIFRPHFKTHQNKEVGHWFRNEGVSKITVSSVAMAEEFAHQGWEDITIAFPINLRELENINRLAQNTHINILVDSLYSTQILNHQIVLPIIVMIKIDVGYHRCGLVPNDPEIDQIIDEIAASNILSFGGFLTHAGHTYQAKGHAEILDIMEDSKRQLLELKHHYERFHPEFILSYGDTPSCSLAHHFHGFDEIRPGNFVYYDVMQFHLGSCSLNQIAVTVACPVVSVAPNENKMTIYGGGVHLSKEYIDADNDFKLFGYVVRLDENLQWGEPIAGAYVYSLSQEHGLIHMPEIELKNFNPGDLIGVLPIHSCMTANLLKENTLIIN
jgi:D-serine deaminase-like pyridoxal phosphate-dependent protein